jgi:phosphonate transport system substrate-binding protein
MGRRYFLISITVILSIFAMASNLVARTKAPKVATIGFIPGDDPDWLKKNGLELAKALQQKLGVPFNIYISKDYSGLISAMKEKKVDFAFFSALTYVIAEQKAGAKVLLKKVWDGPFYYSAIITLKNSKINSIEALKGKRFGYVDEKSVSGHLYPQVLLKKKKFDPNHFFAETKFFGQHEASVKALINGQVDAVAVYADDSEGKSGAWTKLIDLKGRARVKILWVSDPIPNDPFCVRQDFYDDYPFFTHDVMFSLIDFKDETPEKNLLKRLYGINGMELATSRQYEPVRDLVKFLDLKTE